MQMIHPLHAGAVRPLRAPIMASVDERVVEIKTRARQQRILRTTLLLLGSALLICVLVLLRTDTQRHNLAADSLEAPMRALQARINALGFLPATIDEDSIKGLNYLTSMADRFYAMHADKAIIGSSDKVSMYLRPSGRFVVWYDHGKLFTQWMNMAEYDSALRTQHDQMRAMEDRMRSRPPELP